jgi:hypothetical protein
MHVTEDKTIYRTPRVFLLVIWIIKIADKIENEARIEVPLADKISMYGTHSPSLGIVSDGLMIL